MQKENRSERAAQIGKQQESQSSRLRPERVIDVGDVRAAFFRCNYRSKKGTMIETLKISFGKRYQKDGQWQTTCIFDPKEIRTAIHVLMRVESYLSTKQASTHVKPMVPVSESEDEETYAEMNCDNWLEAI